MLEPSSFRSDDNSNLLTTAASTKDPHRLLPLSVPATGIEKGELAGGPFGCRMSRHDLFAKKPVHYGFDAVVAPELLEDVGVCSQLLVDACKNPAAIESSFQPNQIRLADTQRCTYCHTEKRHMPQIWMECFTCGLTNDRGVCQVCAETCHAGHDLSEEHYSSFFCDCGAEGPGRCQSLPRTQDCCKKVIAARGEGKVMVAQTSTAILSENSKALYPAKPHASRMRSRTRCMRILVKRRINLSESKRVSLRLTSSNDRRTGSGRVEFPFKRAFQSEEGGRSQLSSSSSPSSSKPLSFAIQAMGACLEQLGDTPDPSNPFLQYLGNFVESMQPMTTFLPAEEHHIFDQIARLYIKTGRRRRELLQADAKRSGSYAAPMISSPSSSSSSSSSSPPEAGHVIRLWLGCGSMEHILNALMYLISNPELEFPSSSLGDFLLRWQRQYEKVKSGLFFRRVGNTSHITELVVSKRLGPEINFTYTIPGALRAAAAAAFGREGTGSTPLPCLHCQVFGKVYRCRKEFIVHAGGSIACVGGQHLALRTPFLPPSELLLIDAETLDIVEGARLVLHEDNPASPSPRHPACLPSQEDCAAAWDLEYEVGEKDWYSIQSAATTSSSRSRERGDINRAVLSAARDCFLSNWRFGDRCTVRCQAATHHFSPPSSPSRRQKYCATLEFHESGFVFNPKADGDWERGGEDSKEGHRGKNSKATSRATALRIKLGGECLPIFSSAAAKDGQTLITAINARPAPERKKENGGGEEGDSAPLPSSVLSADTYLASLKMNISSSSHIFPLVSSCPLQNGTVYRCLDDDCANPSAAGPPSPAAAAAAKKAFDSGMMTLDAMQGSVALCGSRLVVLTRTELELKNTQQPTMPYAVGDVVDVRDKYGKWYEADILKLHANRRMFVHYHGWNSRWDEWVELPSERVAARNTHTAAKGAAAAAASKKAGGSGSGEQGVKGGGKKGSAAGGDFGDTTERKLIKVYDVRTGVHLQDHIVATDASTLAYSPATNAILALSQHGTVTQWPLYKMFHGDGEEEASSSSSSSSPTSLPGSISLEKGGRLEEGGMNGNGNGNGDDRKHGRISAIEAAKTICQRLECLSTSQKSVVAQVKMMTRVLEKAISLGPKQDTGGALLAMVLDLLGSYFRSLAHLGVPMSEKGFISELADVIKHIWERVIPARDRFGCEHKQQQQQQSPQLPYYGARVARSCTLATLPGFDILWGSWEARFQFLTSNLRLLTTGRGGGRTATPPPSMSDAAANKTSALRMVVVERLRDYLHRISSGTAVSVAFMTDDDKEISSEATVKAITSALALVRYSSKRKDQNTSGEIEGGRGQGRRSEADCVEKETPLRQQRRARECVLLLLNLYLKNAYTNIETHLFQKIQYWRSSRRTASSMPTPPPKSPYHQRSVEAFFKATSLALEFGDEILREAAAAERQQQEKDQEVTEEKRKKEQLSVEGKEDVAVDDTARRHRRSAAFLAARAGFRRSVGYVLPQLYRVMKIVRPAAGELRAILSSLLSLICRFSEVCENQLEQAAAAAAARIKRAEERRRKRTGRRSSEKIAASEKSLSSSPFLFSSTSSSPFPLSYPVTSSSSSSRRPGLPTGIFLRGKGGGELQGALTMLRQERQLLCADKTGHAQLTPLAKRVYTDLFYAFASRRKVLSHEYKVVVGGGGAGKLHASFHQHNLDAKETKKRVFLATSSAAITRRGCGTGGGGWEWCMSRRECAQFRLACSSGGATNEASWGPALEAATAILKHYAKGVGRCHHGFLTLENWLQMHTEACSVGQDRCLTELSILEHQYHLSPSRRCRRRHRPRRQGSVAALGGGDKGAGRFLRAENKDGGGENDAEPQDDDGKDRGGYGGGMEEGEEGEEDSAEDDDGCDDEDDHDEEEDIALNARVLEDLQLVFSEALRHLFLRPGLELELPPSSSSSLAQKEQGEGGGAEMVQGNNSSESIESDSQKRMVEPLLQTKLPSPSASAIRNSVLRLMDAHARSSKQIISQEDAEFWQRFVNLPIFKLPPKSVARGRDNFILDWVSSETPYFVKEGGGGRGEAGRSAASSPLPSSPSKAVRTRTGGVNDNTSSPMRASTSNGPASSPPARPRPQRIASLDSPVICFGLLFQMCLAELGGGVTARKLISTSKAHRFEKMFVALCFKYNGLVARCREFSRSVEIVRLLAAAAKGRKCMFSPLLPPWFRSVIYSTFFEVRKPMLNMIQDQEIKSASAAAAAARPASPPSPRRRSGSTRSDRVSGDDSGSGEADSKVREEEEEDRRREEPHRPATQNAHAEQPEAPLLDSWLEKASGGFEFFLFGLDELLKDYYATRKSSKIERKKLPKEDEEDAERRAKKQNEEEKDGNNSTADAKGKERGHGICPPPPPLFHHQQEARHPGETAYEARKLWGSQQPKTNTASCGSENAHPSSQPVPLRRVRHRENESKYGREQ
eukprot:jgi/Bigna1/137334/aug1.38_g12042